MGNSDSKLPDTFEQELYKLYTYSTQEYDKNILYIASGALGISFAFIEKIVTLKSASFNWVLMAGWVFLTLTILLYLFSHKESKCQTEIFMNNYKLFKNGEITDDQLKKIRKGCNAKIDRYNNYSAFCLIIGILLILVYLQLNL